MRKQYGPLYEVFGEVKRIFDPQASSTLANSDRAGAGSGIDADAPAARHDVAPAVVPEVAPAVESSFNPNESAIQLPTSDTLKFTTTPLPVIELQLNWSPGELLAETKNCNGCGLCRTQLPEHRMCPTFRIGPVKKQARVPRRT